MPPAGLETGLAATCAFLDQAYIMAGSHIGEQSLARDRRVRTNNNNNNNNNNTGNNTGNTDK